MPQPYRRADPPGEPVWTGPRRDRNLSGRCPVAGRITRPTVVARARVGAERPVRVVAADLDGDGKDELLFSEGGELVVRDETGRVRWRNDRRDVELLGIHDLAGRGVGADLVVVLGERTLAVMRGDTGEIIWTHAYTSPAVCLNQQNVRVGPLLPGCRGSQITLWPEGDDDAWLFDFEDGRGRVVWRAPGIGRGELTRYRPNLVSTGDEIIVVEHSIVWSNDARTGRRLWEVRGPNLRNYGFAGLFDVDGDGERELVLVNNAVQLHLSAIRVGDDARYLWDLDLGMTEHVMSTVNCPVLDLDGDGNLEIVYSLGSLVRNDWRVEIRDARTSDLRNTLWGARLVEALDLDGDGLPELVLEDPVSRIHTLHRVAAAGDRRIAEIGGLPIPRVELDERVDRTWKAFWVRQTYGCPPPGARARGQVLPVAASDGVVTLELDAAGRVSRRAAVPLAPDARACALVGEAGAHRLATLRDDWLSLWTLDGGWTARLEVRPMGLPPEVMVADVDGDGVAEILVSGSALRLGSAGDAGPREIWRYTQADPAAGPPTVLCVADVNGDGFPETVLRESDSHVVVLDRDGRRLWSVAVKGDFRGAGIASCVSGRFTRTAHADLCVNAYAVDQYRNELVMLDGRTGREIWRRRDGHDSGLGPVDGYAAVRDMDGDGLDDLFFLSGDVIMALDGEDGRDLIERRELGRFLGTRWVGSGHLALADVDGDGNDEVFLSAIWGLNAGLLRWDAKGLRPSWHHYYGNETTITSPPRWRHQGIAAGPGGARVGGQMLDHRFGCYDGSTGKLLWAYELGAAIPGETVTADLDGDGSDEFLFGATDGGLYSLRRDGVLHFRLEMGAPVGNPVVADVDGDGIPEIVVSTADGLVHVVR